MWTTNVKLDTHDCLNTETAILESIYTIDDNTSKEVTHSDVLVRNFGGQTWLTMLNDYIEILDIPAPKCWSEC